MGPCQGRNQNSVQISVVKTKKKGPPQRGGPSIAKMVAQQNHLRPTQCQAVKVGCRSEAHACRNALAGVCAQATTNSTEKCKGTYPENWGKKRRLSISNYLNFCSASSSRTIWQIEGVRFRVKDEMPGGPSPQKFESGKRRNDCKKPPKSRETQKRMGSRNKPTNRNGRKTEALRISHSSIRKRSPTILPLRAGTNPENHERSRLRKRQGFFCTNSHYLTGLDNVGFC